MRVGLRMDKRLSRRNGLGRMFHESVPDLQRTRQMHAVRWIRKDGDHARNLPDLLRCQGMHHL